MTNDQLSRKKENMDASCQIIWKAPRFFVKKSGNVAKAPLAVATDHGYLTKAPLSVARNSVKPEIHPLLQRRISVILRKHPLLPQEILPNCWADHGYLAKAPPAIAKDSPKLAKSPPSSEGSHHDVVGNCLIPMKAAKMVLSSPIREAT